jgi:nicotinamidase-related amidase
MQNYSGNQLLARHDTVLLIIDVQERLMPVIYDGDKVLNNIVKLLRFAKIIGLPVLVTEQEKLGPTVQQIREVMPDLSPISKVEFDACKNHGFFENLDRLARNSVVVTGVEAHICIAQTVLHLIPRYRVHVVSDAVSSRSRDNWDVALQRMRQGGAVISSTEMVIYELLERAGTEEFREALRLVK